MNRMLLGQMLFASSTLPKAALHPAEPCLRLLETEPTGISVVLLDIHAAGVTDGFTTLYTVLEAGQRPGAGRDPDVMISSEDNARTRNCAARL